MGEQTAVPFVLGAIIFGLLMFISWRRVTRYSFAITTTAILIGFCYVSGVIANNQNTLSYQARAELSGKGYVMRTLQAPMWPLQDFDTIKTPYGLRSTDGFLGAWLNDQTTMTSPGFGYVDFTYYGSPHAAKTNGKFSTSSIPCVVRYGLWRDDEKGWYPVPGSGSVIDPGGYCAGMLSHDLDRAILR